MSSMRNWKRFHSPGDKMSTFTRSIPVDANEKATALTKKSGKGMAAAAYKEMLKAKAKRGRR